MARYVILVLFSVSVLSSCRKKDNTGYLTTSEAFSPPKINGSFYALKAYNLSNDTLYPEQGVANGFYYDTLVNKETTSGYYGLDIGNVSLNNISFSKISSSSGTSYYDTTGSVGYAFPLVWQISGTSTLNPISHTTINFPSYTGTALLPDTIDLSKGVKFLLRYYSPVDNIEVSINDGYAGFIEKNVPVQVDTVKFSNSELFMLSGPSNIATIMVVFYRSEYKVINNKVFRFKTGLAIRKVNVYIK